MLKPTRTETKYLLAVAVEDNGKKKMGHTMRAVLVRTGKMGWDKVFTNFNPKKQGIQPKLN